MDSGLLKSLEKSGWHLDPEGVSELIDPKTKVSNSNELIKLALNADLRNIGTRYLPDVVASGRTESFEGPAVLQLVKSRNIGAPKEFENSMTAPPMFKLTLTDGSVNCNALALEDIKGLNLNTAPGTKFQLKGTIKIKSNLLILTNQNCQVLGGYVDYLVAKWKTNKELAQHVRVSILTETAPPPWVPFGSYQKNQVDTSKKVLQQSESNENDESSEFSQARQAALAEAMEAKLKITKTFTQSNVDKSIAEKPTGPVSSSQLNQIYALGSRQHNSASMSSSGAPAERVKSSRGRGGRRGRGRRGGDSDDDDYVDPQLARELPKPTAAVTLFDLVKTKLDIKPNEPAGAASNSNANQPAQADYSNRMPTGDDYSYNQHYGNARGGGRGGRGDRGGRGGQGGRSGRGSARGGRGGGRFDYQQQSQSTANQQVYDKDDFAFDLGDTTRIKDLKDLKPSSSSSNQASNPSQSFGGYNNYQPNNSNSYQNRSNDNFRGNNGVRSNQRSADQQTRPNRPQQNRYRN